MRIPQVISRRIELVVIVVIFLAVGGTALLWNAHTERAQQAQGRVIERKLCVTLDRLAALQPPAGPPAANPSRSYEQDLHRTLAQLGPDIGCPAVSRLARR